jgi:hypothetical protein
MAAEPTALETLFTDYNAEIIATADEIASWNPIDPRAATVRLMSGRLGVDNTVVTSVGLFGYDLTDFLDECATLEETEECTVADYDAYTGWAVGVNWDGVEDNAIDGVVFTESLWSVQVEWDATTNDVQSAIVDEVSATAPLAADAADLEAAVDGFAAWGADAGATGEQFAFAFFEDDGDFYFEAEDTTSIWATAGAVVGATGNVETAEFAFVGAASLTAATSVIVASLLF